MNQPIQLLDAPETDANTARLKGVRLLKGHELPKSGDLYATEHGFEPWEGPAGFRADAFVKTIYRPDKKPSRHFRPVVFSVPNRTFNSQLG